MFDASRRKRTPSCRGTAFSGDKAVRQGSTRTRTQDLMSSPQTATITDEFPLVPVEFSESYPHSTRSSVIHTISSSKRSWYKREDLA